jgi:hypothetical protein
MRLLSTLTLALGLICCTGALAQTLFESEEILEIELRGPVGETIRDDRQRREHDFTITVDGIETSVAVRARGKSRLEQCRFPPLRLRFSGEDASGTLFEGFDKLKLVTHCRDNPHYDQNLLDEYAAYRIFALLSDRSHRVRLLRITYVDTARSNKAPLVRYAFALEPIEQVAARTGLELLEVPHVAKSLLDRSHSALVFVYHYLIGNTDWSLVTADDEEYCCHNGRLLLSDGKYQLIPYDFDLSGFVNARYAKPRPELPIRNVRKRLYRGYCLSELPLESAIRSIVAHRDQIRGLVRSLPATSGKETEERLEYLDKFFELAADPSLAQRWTESCIG